MRRESRRPPTNPNAAKLYLNWCLSKEGQTFMIKELGNLTSLKEPPALPGRFRSQGGQGLVSEFRPVCEAACRMGCRLGQDLRLSAVSAHDEIGDDHDGDARSHRPAQAVRDRPPGDRRRQLCRAGGRDRGAAGAVRLRQDHDAALRRGSRASDRSARSASPAGSCRRPPTAFWCRRACATSAWCSSPMRCGRI